MSEIEAKYDWVIVEEFSKDPEKTESGIYVAQGMSEDVIRGRVKVVGIGKALENGHVREPQTHVGALVLFQDVGHRFFQSGKPYRAIKEEDIICEIVSN